MKPSAKLLAGLLVSLVLAPRAAQASKDYPAALQNYFRMGGRPIPAPGTKGCRLCHKDEVGGNGTATRPFGLTLKKNAGVVGGNPTSLQKGLYYVATQMTNSDGDPVSDYVEIVVDGTDPNDATKYTRPASPASEGGQGGDSSTHPGEGGQASGDAFQPPPLPPPPGDLAPPYVHGCALGSSRAAPGMTEALLAAGALAWAASGVRRKRRRAATERSLPRSR